MDSTFVQVILTLLVVAVLWGAYELHQLRQHLDGQARHTRTRQRLSPHLFDQEQP